MSQSKRKAWLEHYFQCGMNATEAARRAGYKWPNKVGHRIQEAMQAEIDARLDEMAMSSREVLARLGEMARSDISDFVTDYGAIDWAAVKKKGWLVKKISHHAGQESTIEIYDAQSALMHLDRHHGGKGGGPLDYIVRVVGGMDVEDI